MVWSLHTWKCYSCVTKWPEYLFQQRENMHFRLHNTGKKYCERPEERNIFSCRAEVSRAAAHEHNKWLTQRRQGNAKLPRPPRMTSSFCAGLKVSDILKPVAGIHLRRTRSHTRGHSARKCTRADNSTSTRGLFWSHIIPQRPAGAEQMWRVGSVLEAGGGSYLWQLPPSATVWHSPKEGDEELHQVHDAVVLREGDLGKEENA